LATELEDIKGWFFVAVTALLLGLALDRYFREFRRSAQLLQDSDQRWQFALKGAGQAAWEWNAQTSQVFHSTEWKTMLGFAPQEIGDTFGEWKARVHPEDLPLALANLQRHLDGQAPIYLSEQRLRCKDGSFKWVLSQGKVMSRTADGKPLRVLGTHSDITQRKQAEDELRRRLELQDRIARIAMTVPGMIYSFLMRPDGSFCMPFATSSIEELCGLQPEDVREDFSPLLARVHPDDAGPLRESIAVSAHAMKPWRAMFRLLHPRRGEVWVEAQSEPRLEADGGILWHGYVQDITERKQLESQLRQAQKLEAIGQLAGGVAHDFNNILAAIMMHLGLLQLNPALDEETRHALTDLDAQARRAASLTRQLLMFSRRSVLAVKPVDLNEVVANLLKMLRRLIGEHIDLRFDGKSALPLVEADAGMIDQVLMNLTVNARDAMPKGGRITISTTLADVDAAHTAENPNRRAGRFVCLAVSDTGCGMDAATLKRMFEPFFTTKDVGKGTGLGLATVHGIAAQHKGWVEVDSQVGVGSTFRVYLPVTTQAPEPAAQPPQAGPIRRGRETILLVEDDSQVRQVVGRSLRALGYRVHEAGNGQEAMALWQTHGAHLDLLLTDMVMPEGMTGLELTEQLQALKPGLQAIISSGYSTEIVHAGVPAKAGVVYLSKPYATKVLADVIRERLDQKKRPASEP
jgi:hypothetical protein